MKFFNWMQNKHNGSNGKKKPNSTSANHHMLHEPCKDEFSDWPQALLAIGTFGNDNLKEDLGRSRTNTIAEDSSSSQDCVQELTPEEEGNLQNDLEICCRGRVESNLTTEQEKTPTEEMNNCLNSEHLSFKLERKENETFSDGSYGNSLIPGRGKDLCLDNSKSAIGRKSLSFLLKKIFVCRSGFQLTPSFKDPLSTESRMEKILRAILNKKIYPQGSSSTMIIKKYLENRPSLKMMKMN